MCRTGRTGRERQGRRKRRRQTGTCMRVLKWRSLSSDEDRDLCWNSVCVCAASHIDRRARIACAYAKHSAAAVPRLSMSLAQTVFNLRATRWYDCFCEERVIVSSTSLCIFITCLDPRWAQAQHARSILAIHQETPIGCLECLFSSTASMYMRVSYTNTRQTAAEKVTHAYI